MASSSVATVKGGETLERSMTVLFSVKFSAYHRPNVKSNYSFLNTLKTSMGILWEAKGCLKSCSIILNFFFYLFFVVVEGSALLQCLKACMESSLTSSKCCSN